ncbi:ribosomal RNA small subunit methyltransferase A [bacterium 3DAC]|nr:ribosomal RNA small subunit methyltransferase A [bacterium 3DAC]
MYEIREKYKHLIPKPKKGLGQHFLKDHSVSRRIADYVWKDGPDYILEIGPGAGDLTFALLEKGPVVAVEIDNRLKPFWETVIKDVPHLTIIWADFLKLREDDIPTGTYNTTGNLPYMIGTTIITHLVKYFPSWKLGAFMLQKEVARRIKAQKGKEKSSLSIWMQTYTEIVSSFLVKPGAFSPPPKVMSEVIFLKRRETPLCNIDYDKWEKFLKGVFRQKRKTLANNLRNMGYSKQCIEHILNVVGLKPTIRGEEVSVETLCHVYTLLSTENICKNQYHT